MTFAELRARVLKRLDDDGFGYTAAEVNSAINEGLQFFAWLTLCLEGAGDLTTGASIQPLAIFPDYIAPLRVTVGGVKIRPATPAQLDALDNNWRANTGAPARYWSKGWNLMGFYGSAGATAAMVYARSAAPLANDGDVPEIPELYHPVLADYGVYRVLAPQGGSMLAKALTYFAGFLAAATRVNALVRARSLALRYDTLPMELERYDLSRVTSIRKDLLPARKEQPEWTPTK